MYISETKPIFRDSSLRKRNSDYITSINYNLQGVNCSILTTSQANLKRYFKNEYANLNKTGWKNIFDTERNIDDKAQYSRLRRKGVSTAWRYEKFSIKLGGKGSANWNKSERAQILRKGRVEGAQGHHQMNVHNHPDFMAEASYIKFFRGYKEHLEKGHGGNFRNESNKDFIDKDQMVIHNYERSLLRQEAYAVGFSALIGFSLSTSLTLITELTENGIDPKNIKKVLLHASLEGTKGAGSSLLYYGGFRIGGAAIEEIANCLSLSGKTLKFLKSGSGKIAILGGVIIIGDSIIQTTKDLSKGTSIGEALLNTSKKQAVPLVLLAMTCINPPAGGVASVLTLGYGVLLSYFKKQLMKKIEDYTFDCLYKKACFALNIGNTEQMMR